MLETQALRLNRSRLRHLREGEYCLCLEPLSLKSKHLERLLPGAWIDLGGQLPELQIRRDGRKVARVHPASEGWYVGECVEEEPDLAERKRVLLEGRIAVLPAERVMPGERIELPPSVFEQVLLCRGEEPVALAALARCSEGYGLQVRERCDG